MQSTRGKIKAERVARVVLGVFFVLLVTLIVIGSVVLYRAVSNTWGKASGAEATVPNVIGMTQTQAEEALRARGLGAQVVQNENSDEQAAGNIFRQDPPAGRGVRPGRTVKLTISLGPPVYTVPSLIGEQLEQAPQILEHARLRLGVVSKVFKRGAKRGRIVNQNPAAGISLASPAAVDVTVEDSSGLPTVVVPPLCGQSLAQAEDLLVKGNLQLARVTYVADDASAEGTVTSQKPDANADAALGDKVELVVALPTAVKTAAIKTLTVRIRIPQGPDKQHVKIKVFDNLGAQVVQDTMEQPGGLYEAKVPVEGDAKIQIYIGDITTPFREEIL
jgi:beta-lactam-binding protein with PASTA domain